MSQLSEFLRNAEAALLGANNSKDEAEKLAFVDLARVLARAALEDAVH